MVFADGNPAFGSTFGARFSSPEAGATSSVSNAPPDAAKAVDKLAESFREMLMRAVESDPSQVRALTSLVSNLGLEAGDGTSQQEIKKMTESLNKLSVGKDAIGALMCPLLFLESAQCADSFNPESIGTFSFHICGLADPVHLHF